MVVCVCLDMSSKHQVSALSEIQYMAGDMVHIHLFVALSSWLHVVQVVQSVICLLRKQDFGEETPDCFYWKVEVFQR